MKVHIYQKRPVYLAIQWDGGNWEEIKDEFGNEVYTVDEDDAVVIRIKETATRPERVAYPGWWIIRDEYGHICPPLSDDQFLEKYEVVPLI